MLLSCSHNCYFSLIEGICINITFFLTDLPGYLNYCVNVKLPPQKKNECENI